MAQLELNSGTSIPQLGFGTYATAQTADSVAAALRTGYRQIDTAQMYQNEAGVGEGVRASGIPRDEVFVTTKLNNPHHHPDDVHRTFNRSLDELGFDYVDLFLIHWPLPMIDIDYVDTWRAMIGIAESGRAKAIGVSNFLPEHLDRIIDETGVVPAANQIEVHPYFANNEVRAYCADKGILVQAWSPLGKGDEFGDPVLTDVASRVGRSEAQVILRWHIQRGDVVIPKTDRPARMQENFTVFDFELSTEEMSAIDALDKGEAGRRGGHPSTFGA